MDLGIAGKKAIVCAASKGLGKACATSLAREGVDVTICARTEETLNAAADEIRALGGGKVQATPGQTIAVTAPAMTGSVGQITQTGVAVVDLTGTSVVGTMSVGTALGAAGAIVEETGLVGTLGFGDEQRVVRIQRPEEVNPGHLAIVDDEYGLLAIATGSNEGIIPAALEAGSEITLKEVT